MEVMAHFVQQTYHELQTKKVMVVMVLFLFSFEAVPGCLHHPTLSHFNTAIRGQLYCW